MPAVNIKFYARRVASDHNGMRTRSNCETPRVLDIGLAKNGQVSP
jgi:hypothetical protein